ncbi:glycosyltransferase family 2 protein [Treponema lecithinolyticum]
MKKNKIISIIVPIYNRSSFLPACIESIIKQSYPYLDVILVDDGSTDNSLAICKKYAQKDKRIKVISIQNSGVSTARNTGMQHASGDFIQFVDSDDMLKQNACEILLNVQKRHNADIVICGIDHIDTTGAHLFYECTETPIYSINRFFTDFGNLLELNLLRSPVNKLYKKQIILEHNLVFPLGFNIAEDALFNLEYYNYMQSIAVIPQSLYNCINYISDSRLTQRFHSNYFYIQNLFFKKLIELLTAKKIYNHKNKKIVKKQYAQIIFTGVRLLKNTDQNVNYHDISQSILPNIFRFSDCRYIITTWKIYDTISYIKNSNLILKKIYGVLKFIYWQYVKIYNITQYFRQR